MYHEGLSGGGMMPKTFDVRVSDRNVSTTSLIPILHIPIQAPRDHPTRLPRMPRNRRRRSVTCLDLVVHLARFPIPEADEASTVA